MERLITLQNQLQKTPLVQGTNSIKYDVVFIGAGKMVTAIVTGLIKQGKYKPWQMACTSAPDGTGEQLRDKTNIAFYPNVEDLFPKDSSDGPLILLGFKPQNLSEIDEKLKLLTKGKIMISILAGSTVKALKKSFPHARNIVRSMPNIAGIINKAVTCYTSSNPLNEDEMIKVQNILGAFGSVVKVEEKELDAVTGLSGSGPAYVFEFIAALRDGGVAMGLKREVAQQLAIETVMGSSKMVKKLNTDPDKLTPLVTSKGGTTFAGLEIFKKYDFHKIMKETVEAATRRATELGKLGEQ